MHDHDGSGCLDCKCSGSPMNTWPCTCPANERGELASRMGNDGEDHRVNQAPLIVYGGSPTESTYLGEMTQTIEGTHITVCIQLADEYKDLAAVGNWAVSYYPSPSYPLPVLRPHAAVDLFVKQQAEKNLDIPDSVVLGEN